MSDHVRFDVKHGRKAEFEQLHAVDGEWTATNRTARTECARSIRADLVAAQIDLGETASAADV
jgi:hypothetical protein